jgi:hypothetical protein
MFAPSNRSFASAMLEKDEALRNAVHGSGMFETLNPSVA